MSTKKKVAIIGTNGLPARYGGFETLTSFLVEYLGSEFDIVVYCSKTPKKQQIKSYKGVRLVYLPFYANGGQSIIYDIVAIVISWFRYDTLVILGTPGCIILPFLKVFKQTNTVINFGGLEWKRNKWNGLVRKYLKLTESVAINHATAIVADNQYFGDYIKEEYRKNSIIIEYGGNHVSKLPVTIDLIKSYPFLFNDYAISISRAQPDNNLHILLDAFSKTPENILVLVSNWNNSLYGKELKNQYSDFPNLYLLDAIYDLKILDALRSNARLYIHSHTFCGTAPSLVEAMNLGLPIISYLAMTNLETTEKKALYFQSSEELQEIIAKTDEDTLNILRTQMKEIARRRYTWDRISNKYAELF